MFTIIVVTIVTALWIEFMWSLFKKGIRSYNYINRLLKIWTVLNYGLAFWIHAGESMTFGIICSLYQMVILKERMRNLK